MSNGYDVSVVISTYNRCKILPLALESIITQESAGVSFEVVVVDNNSNDQTRQVIESFIARGHSNIKYIFEGRQGLSHGWNTGISNASAPIIAFTDDDLCMEPNWIASIKRSFDEHPEVDYIGGSIVARWPVERPDWCVPTVYAGPLAITEYGDVPFYIDKDSPVCMISKYFRREAFERIGCFDPDFGRVKDSIGSAEDHELQLRLWSAGGVGLYVPHVVVNVDVPLERMTKAYHRRWHAGHGRYCAMMRIKEILDTDGRLVGIQPSTSKLFGTPAFVYRELLVVLAIWLASVLRMRFDVAFRHECQARHLINYITKTYVMTTTEQKHSKLAEIRQFAKTLLRKKLSYASELIISQ